MWNDDRSKISAQLGSGETLIWYGRPRQGVFFRPMDFAIFAAMIFQGVFLWFFLGEFDKTGFGPFSWIMTTIYGINVAYFLVIRYFVDSYRRGKTYYGITNERAIIIRSVFSEEVTSIPKASMKELTLKMEKNGLGTIVFDANTNAGTGVFGSRNQSVPPQFEQIVKPKETYELIRGL